MDKARPGNSNALRSYLTGLGLAFVLTAIPFALVAFNVLPKTQVLLVIAVAAILQIGVHLRYFLHINLTQTPRETLMTLFLAILLIAIMVGGSLMIMFDLQNRMM